MKTLLIICALAIIPGKKTEIKIAAITQLTINYYWFDTSGTYIRQNQLITEATITGYNNNPDNPKTLQELGYDPNNCTGSNPPVPNDPSSPDQKLYSHP